jgi:hypothetical protein
MNDKTDKATLKKALAALRPFAHLPISDMQPDEAHPAFQVQVGFVRAARALFDPADFGAPANPASPEPTIEAEPEIPVAEPEPASEPEAPVAEPEA